MPSSYAEEIAQSLPGMSKPDRDYLRAQLEALDKFDPIEIDQSDWLFYSFVTELRSRNIWMDIKSIQTKPAYRKFAKQSKEIRDYLENAIPHMMRVEKIRFGGEVARLLANDLSKWAKLSLDAMMANVDKIPPLLDQQLPGYRQAGWLGLIVRREANGN
jgi:hypothetical protein